MPADSLPHDPTMRSAAGVIHGQIPAPALRAPQADLFFFLGHDHVPCLLVRIAWGKAVLYSDQRKRSTGIVVDAYLGYRAQLAIGEEYITLAPRFN